MRNKQINFEFWSLILEEYLDVTFEYWRDLNEHDLSVIDFRVTDINNGASIPQNVKDEIDEHISFEIYNLIEQ